MTGKELKSTKIKPQEVSTAPIVKQDWDEFTEEEIMADDELAIRGERQVNQRMLETCRKMTTITLTRIVTMRCLMTRKKRKFPVTSSEKGAASTTRHHLSLAVRIQ